MAWEIIANLRGIPGDAISLAELANRPKSTVPDLASGTNLNTMHQQQHVGWHGFVSTNVTGGPDGMGTSTSMLEVIAPTQWAAVQRIHDRTNRASWERSVISPTSNTWSFWRQIATTDTSLTQRGIIGDVSTPGNVADYRTTDHFGIWTLWAPYNTGLPKDTRGRCTLQVLRDPGGATTHILTERESGRTWTNVYDGAWAGWTDLTNRGPLTSFWNALGKSRSQPVNVVVVGDSNSEGLNIAEGISDRWINKIQPALNRKAGSWPGAKFPFIPAKYNITEAQSPGLPVELTGNYVWGSYEWGFGARTAALRDGTSKAVFTFVGTSASVMYVEGANAGVMNIQVDSNPVTVVNTKAATTTPSKLWNTGPLNYATHTITVTWNSANVSGDLVYLEGLLTWNNDETRGVRMIDASFVGRQMADMTEFKANYLCRAMVAMGNIGLVIVNLATNDARWDTPEAEYRANAERIVSMMRTYNIQVPVVFVLPFVGADHTRDKLNFYGGILGNIASNTRGVHFVDLSLDMPKVPDDRTSAASQGLYVDNLHMSGQGHTAFAGHMMHALME